MISTHGFFFSQVCTLAIERNHSKPRFRDERWNKVILRAESKRVVVLQWQDLVEKFCLFGWKFWKV